MTADPSPKLYTLANGLSAHPDRYPWAEMERDPWGTQGFELTLPRSTVELESNEGDYPITLRVRGERGEEIDALTVSGQRTDHVGLKQLYMAVSRSLRNIDNRLQEVLDELGIDAPPF